MYKAIKNLLIKALPGQWLHKSEPWLRKLYAIRYSGSNVYCNVCEGSFSAFIESDSHTICPSCGSIARNRRLWNILNQMGLNDDITVLDFSPSRCLYRKMHQLTINYIATDLSDDFIADHKYDITKLPMKSGSVDLIICYHILEHVPNDSMAMSELFRVLNDKGTCLIQTPFKQGDIYENEAITSPEARLEHFGQEDHVRIYSMDGLSQRLKNQGFKFSILEFDESAGNRNGYSTTEVVLKCTKS